MDESKERSAELVVAGSDAAEILQFVEEALDEAAFLADGRLPAVALLAVGFVGNIGDGYYKQVRLAIQATPVCCWGAEHSGVTVRCTKSRDAA